MTTQFVYSATDDLYAMEDEMPAYNRFIARLISKSFRELGVEGSNVLDYGAGIGTISLELRKSEGITPLTLEIDGEQAAVLEGRGFKVFRGLDEVPVSLSGCFASNVLEHIEDDQAALKSIRNHMVVGGVLAIYVPAFQVLWTDSDVRVNHCRRYTRGSLTKVLTRSGFEVHKTCYCDSLGFLATL